MLLLRRRPPFFCLLPTNCNFTEDAISGHVFLPPYVGFLPITGTQSGRRAEAMEGEESITSHPAPAPFGSQTQVLLPAASGKVGDSTDSLLA